MDPDDLLQVHVTCPLCGEGLGHLHTIELASVVFEHCYDRHADAPAGVYRFHAESDVRPARENTNGIGRMHVAGEVPFQLPIPAEVRRSIRRKRQRQRRQ